MSTKFQIMCCCINCKQETTTGQLTRNHIQGCPSKQSVRFPGNIGRTAWNKGLSKDTDSRVAKNAIAVKASAKEIGRCKDPEKELLRRQKLSIAAKKSGFGGYRENAGRSKKFRVVDSFGKETTLQSTFELRCSEILNSMRINWVRPKALKYDGRNYFADFYLPDYDLWLDPKNNYKALLDAEKIRKVIEQNNVKLFILLEHQLTTEFIKGLCS